MTTENGLPHPRHVRHNIERLRDRLNYLTGRVDECAAIDRSIHPLVVEEINALTWALPVLEAEYDNVSRMWTDFHMTPR